MINKRPMKITVNNLDIELELRKESANEFEVEVGGAKTSS